MKTIALFVLLSVPALGQTVTGYGKHKPRFLFVIPHGHAVFTMQMEEGDSFHTVAKCLHDIHVRGGGVCEIEPHSLKPSRHAHDLQKRKYKNTGIIIKPVLEPPVG
jgi:hypothetical protein